MLATGWYAVSPGTQSGADRLALQAGATAAVTVGDMLRPGGHLLLTCPTGRVFATEKHFGHTTHPTPREIGERATQSGFTVKRLINWGFPTYYALKWATNVNAEWALKNFSNTQYGAKQIVVSEALYWLNHLNLRSSRAGCQLFVLLEKSP